MPLAMVLLAVFVAALPAASVAQTGSGGAHPVQIGGARSLDFVAPAGGLVVYVFSEHEGVDVWVESSGGERILEFVVGPGHHTRAVETGDRPRIVSVSADGRVWAAWAPRDGFLRVTDLDVYMPCSARREAALWSPPESDRVMVDRSGVPSGVHVYGDGGLRLFSSTSGPGEPLSFPRPAPSGTLWVINEPYGSSCSGSYRFSVEGGGARGAGGPASWPVWSLGVAFGLVLASALVFLIRTPHLPRRG